MTAIKNLAEQGIEDIVCFEQNPWIGGNWKYTATESHSSVCSTTHVISSKKMSEYTDFPMPDDYPDYPSHQQVLEYFESYADTFQLKRFIQFNSKVESVKKNEDQSWSIRLTGDQLVSADYLLVANGHHSAPKHPEWKDDFSGIYSHSHSFKNNDSYEDKRVLVVGAGNSACDCAVEISRVAKQVDISIRTAQYIVPKFVLGQPTDVMNANMRWIPGFLRGILLKLSLRFQIGKYSDYGLAQPKHGVQEAHPTLNSELLYKIRHGKVHPRPAIEHIESDIVHFIDGSSQKYDHIVAATGYKIETAFFDKDFLDYSNSDRVELYLRMMHPDHPSLFFVGLFQPQGAIWPASDLQSQIIARYIKGDLKLPENIAERASKEADEIERKFLRRKRHVLEVDYHDFANKLKKVLRS